VPVVDPVVIVAVAAELGRGGYPSVSAIAERLHLPKDDVRGALVVLERQIPEHPARRDWHRAAVEDVEVSVVRARPRPER